MDGLNLDMLGTEEVEKLFSDNGENGESQEPEEQESGEKEETAEVDFSDLGITPESVGRGESEEHGEAPAPKSAGTQNQNLFFSIAKALRDEGVFPDLSDETLDKITDAATLRQMFVDENSKLLDERQRRIEEALNGGATSEEVQVYQQALNIAQFLDRKDTYETLIAEGEDGEKLRKQVMYQDYVNRGFKHEKAVKMVEKSIDDGTDIEDAKEAYESCKDFYKEKVDGYQKELEARQSQQKAAEEKQYATLKKHILDTESFYDGVKVDRQTRQKAYDSITKPVYRDDEGNYLTALQKYQRENPAEFMENVALLFALTDNFKNVDKLAGSKAKAKIKSSFDEVANLLNNSKRNGDGTLNLANSAPDTSGREGWELAI